MGDCRAPLNPPPRHHRAVRGFRPRHQSHIALLSARTVSLSVASTTIPIANPRFVQYHTQKKYQANSTISKTAVLSIYLRKTKQSWDIPLLYKPNRIAHRKSVQNDLFHHLNFYSPIGNIPSIIPQQLSYK